MDSSRRGYFIENGCCYFTFLYARRKFLLVQEERKNISIRKHACYGVDYPFATGQRDKPMMNYSYSHTLEANSMLPSAWRYGFIHRAKKRAHLFAHSSSICDVSVMGHRSRAKTGTPLRLRYTT